MAAAAASPSERGCVLASGGYDGAVRLWDLAPLLGSLHDAEEGRGGRPAPPVKLGALSGHTQWVTAVAHLGGRLASASYDCTVRVWSAPSGRSAMDGSHEAAQWSTSPLVLRHAHPVAALCGVAKNSVVAAGCYDFCVHLWCPVRGDLLHVLRGHGETVWSLAPTYDGNLVSGAADNTLRIWTPQEGGSGDESAHPALGIQTPASPASKKRIPRSSTPPVPLTERSMAHMLSALVRRLLNSTWAASHGLASGTTPIEWKDLFGSECNLRRPIVSFFRAMREIFSLAVPYYRRA